MAGTVLPTRQAAPHINPWNEIAGPGVAVMEASWVALLFQSLNDSAAAASTPLVLAYFAFVFWAAWQMLRAFVRFRLVSNAARAILLAAYLLSVWAGIGLLLPEAGSSDFDPFTTSLRGIGEITALIPAWVWLLPALLWLFWRGTWVARQGVGTFSVQRHFRLGVIMFIAYSLLAFTSNRDLPGLGVFVVFLFATLLAMAAARVAILGRLRGGRRSPFSRSWFGSLTVGVAATVGAALVIGMLTTGRFLFFLRQITATLLLAAVTITVSPFLFILGLFASTTVNPIQVDQPPTPAAPPWEPVSDGVDLTDVAAQVDTIPPQYRIYFYLAAVLLAAIVILLVFRGVRTVFRPRADLGTDDAVYEQRDLMSALRELFEKRVQAIRDRWSGEGQLSGEQQQQAAVRIRQIYRDLIRLSASFGAPRAPAQTPLEYSAALGTQLSGVHAELGTITDAYLKIRYGGLPERAEEVRAVENAWSSVRSAGEARIKMYEKQVRESKAEERRKERIE